ncbi:hypothetical protein [Proteus hauseri]|uniref:hypothetical protein n=1 Tax=Proteus hauseri TaxID=183417 RepID=UPI0032DAC1D1
MANFDRKRIENNIQKLEEFIMSLESHSSANKTNKYKNENQSFYRKYYIDDEPEIISGKMEPLFVKSGSK